MRFPILPALVSLLISLSAQARNSRETTVYAGILSPYGSIVSIGIARAVATPHFEIVGEAGTSLLAGHSFLIGARGLLRPDELFTPALGLAYTFQYDSPDDVSSDPDGGWIAMPSLQLLMYWQLEGGLRAGLGVEAGLNPDREGLEGLKRFEFSPVIQVGWSF